MDAPVSPDLDQHANFESLVGDITARFVNLDVQQVDHALDNALPRLGKFLEVNRGIILQLDERDQSFVFTHYWSQTGDRPPYLRLDAEKFVPFGIGKLMRGETHCFSSLDELPPDSPDRAYLEQRGVKAALNLPLVIDGKVIGTLGFSSLCERAWDDTVSTRLRVVADVLANALARVRLDAHLRLAAADRVRFETLVGDLAAHFVNLEAEQVDAAIEDAQ